MKADYTTINIAIKNELNRLKISMKDAAAMLGISPQNLNSQLSKPLTDKTARLYADTFGWNLMFMLTGEGTLTGEAVPEQDSSELAEAKELCARYLGIIESQQETIAALAGVKAKKISGGA